MDAVFLQARIDKCKAQIVLYEDMVDSIMSGTEQSYTVNTGQTVTTITRYNIGVLTHLIDTLYNRCSTLDALLNGASTHMVPGW